MSFEPGPNGLCDPFGNAIRLDENGVHIIAATNENVDIIVSGSGQAQVNGVQISTGGDGSVTSVFGRTGAVVAEADDYTVVPNLNLGDGFSSLVFVSVNGEITLTDGLSSSIDMDGVGDISILANGGQLDMNDSTGGDSILLNGSGTVNVVAAQQINLAAQNINCAGPLSPQQFTVVGLPGGASEGMVAYATNGRKVGQGVGAGTGVPVYFSAGAWRVFSTDAQVLA
jgi:hypothetical protein